MNYELTCYDSEKLQGDQFFGRFQLSSFLPGEALTIANTLRRCLLSQLPGVSICYAHIPNTSHEFGFLRAVKQLPSDILLNLKKIILVSDFLEWQPQIAFLKINGPVTVRAKHFHFPFFIHCVNPEQIIAEVNEAGSLELSILIANGKGSKDINLDSEYVAQLFETKINSKQPKRQPMPGSDFTYEESPPHLFPVHGIYSPVLKANYTILPFQGGTKLQNVREIIRFEIWTNGSIDPKKAIHDASTALIQLFLPWQDNDLVPLRSSRLKTKQRRLLNGQIPNRQIKTFFGNTKTNTNNRWPVHAEKKFFILSQNNLNWPNSVNVFQTIIENKQKQPPTTKIKGSFNINTILAEIAADDAEEKLFMSKDKLLDGRRTMQADLARELEHQSLGAIETQKSEELWLEPLNQKNSNLRSSPSHPNLNQTTFNHSLGLDAPNLAMDVVLFYLNLPKEVNRVLKLKDLSEWDSLAQALNQVKPDALIEIETRQATDQGFLKWTLCDFNLMADLLNKNYFKANEVNLSNTQVQKLLLYFYQTSEPNFCLYSWTDLKPFFTLAQNEKTLRDQTS